LLKSIEKAKNFIYILGWTFDETTRNFGKLLKQKKNDGVEVKIIVYIKNVNIPYIKKFSNDLNATNLIKEQMVIEVSHHRKCVICDETICIDNSNIEKAVAYIGGIDFSAGRDDENHYLFNKKSFFNSKYSQHLI
jgi:phosphatidylserine/phosphatidylglycerophosphate/cardiolipin synthase-like enzyme